MATYWPSLLIATVLSVGSVQGIKAGTYSLPPGVDWIGFDQYGCWDRPGCVADCDLPGSGGCCYGACFPAHDNRSIPHNLAVLR